MASKSAVWDDVFLSKISGLNIDMYRRNSKEPALVTCLGVFFFFFFFFLEAWSIQSGRAVGG
jgi:hypothetical protein